MRKESVVTQKASRKSTATQRKRGFFSSLSSSVPPCLHVVSFVLCSLFLASCLMPVDEAGYQPPPGRGAITLNFSNEIARATVLPGTTRDDFTHFHFSFAPTLPQVNGSAQATTLTKTDMEGLTTPYAPVFEVDVGKSYTLIVTADIGTGNVAAIWNSTDTATTIEAANGDNLGVSVVLHAYEPSVGTGNGTFQWDITNSINTSVLTTADMDISRIGSLGSTSIPTINLLDDNSQGGSPAVPQWSGTTALAPGYYSVDIVLEISGQTRTFHHVLHINQNMTSTFEYTFTDDHIGTP